MGTHSGAVVALFLGILAADSAQAVPGSPWQSLQQGAAAKAALPAFKLVPNKYAHFALDEAAMQTLLAEATANGRTTADSAADSAAANTASIAVPLPDGGMVRLAVEETPIMQAELAARFPSIKAYRAHAANGQARDIRLDFTEQGFHAMFNTDQGQVMVDPRTDGNGVRTYISYYKHDYHPADKDPRAMQCLAQGHRAAAAPDSADKADNADNSAAMRQAMRSGTQLTTYRLAVAATGEYTKSQGNSVSAALSAIVTTINRVNSIYERDFAIHLQLVNNNSAIIYTDAATDPYSNDDGEAMLDENQKILDKVIGTANYDIGHVFSTGGGGIAAAEVPCNATYKAQGVTGSPQPVGDPFDIDYVAHEMGHQFGGNHTFNATTGSCGGGNRNAGTAFEPGSGTTVMAYAGICGGENLQSNSDSLFHAGSITEIIRFATSGDGAKCGVRSALSNAAPVANAGAAYTIPAGTPFVLTGSATDANSDTLTYSWDEMDAGLESTPTDMADDGTRALFRSFPPSTSPLRTFPKLASIASATSDIGERLPTTSRSLKFRLTVRDQKGGVSDSDVTLTVSAAAGPFAVTAPKSGDSLKGTGTVTWNVAGTSSAPVRCANVAITLSTDGGTTFPTSLLASTANTGSAAVSFPTGSASSARVKVQCADNIFFNLSPGNFSFDNPDLVPAAPTIGAATASPGGASIRFSAPAGNGGSAVTGYTATCTASGQTAQTGSGTSSPITVSNLSGGVAYACSVTASNGAGAGAASASVSVTPLATSFVLTASVSGLGKVTSSPAGINCGPAGGSATTCSASFANGADVILSATADSDNLLSAWGGSCSASGTATSCTLGMDAAKSLSASFIPRPTAPGAPTIAAATAGFGGASISFSAPTVTGGNAILGYTATCTASGQTTRSGIALASPVTVTDMLGGIPYSCSVTAGNIGGSGSASAALTVTPLNPALGGASALAAGKGHTCVVAAGLLRCWGANDFGQLGDNSTTKRLYATDVAGSTKASATAAGNYHGCALTTTGGVKCWGGNSLNQLGDNSAIQRLTPVDVTSLASGVASIAAGANHSCAVSTAGGVKCWGYNQFGQLGNGTLTRQTAPVAVTGLASGVGAVTVGTDFSCALTTAGGVRCWGVNSFGQLGDNSSTNRLAPVDVSGLSNVVALASGTYHACALTTKGGVKCWGLNSVGQLGDDSTTQRLTPVDVTGLASDVVALASNGSHNCALTTASAVKCWGDNTFGQLGDGSTTQSHTAVSVSDIGGGVAALALGNGHSCALLTGGGVKCWGDNSSGQIGDGSTSQRSTPTTAQDGSTVPGAPSLVSVTAGPASAVLSFTAPTSNGNGVTGYTATCTASGQTTRSASASGSPLTVSGLAGGVSYSCSVMATNLIGNSSPSSALTVLPGVLAGTPVCTLAATPSTLASGTKVALATSCSPSATAMVWTNSGFGTGATDGSLMPFFSTTYSVQGSNGIGSGNVASVSVTVTDTMALSAARANYTLAASGANFVLTDNIGSGGVQTLTGIKRLKFSDTSVALDLDGVGGIIYRLYQTAFNRAPDLGGQGFQMWAMEIVGWSVEQVTQGFMDSAEFKAAYGTTTDQQFIILLYANVFHRLPDEGGLKFYLDGMTAGNPNFTRTKIVGYFSESPENKAQVLPAIQNGIQYTPEGGN